MTKDKNFNETKNKLVRLIIKLSKDYIKDKKIDLSKTDVSFLKSLSDDMVRPLPAMINKVLPGKNLKGSFIKDLKSEIKKTIKPEKQKGEIDELVDDTGTMLGSNIPILKLDLHPRKTTDQTVKMARATQFPFIRVYYGESEEEKENVIDEIDQSEWYGDKETKNAKNYSQANKILKSLGTDDPDERKDRLKKLGFDKKLDASLKREKRRGRCKNCFVKKRLTEFGNTKMEKMIDEILLSKKSEDKEVSKKIKDDETSPMFKFLERNLKSISKIANKEGIEINKLISILKKSE
jgi:hypothetical protein